MTEQEPIAPVPPLVPPPPVPDHPFEAELPADVTP